LGKRLRLRSQPIAFSPDKTLVSSPIYLVRSSYRALDFSTAKIALEAQGQKDKSVARSLIERHFLVARRKRIKKSSFSKQFAQPPKFEPPM
jgi:hypothetical protein